MPNLIINKVPSTSNNLVIDKFVPTVFTPSPIGLLYWRWEDEPTMTPQALGGKQTAGSSVSIPFDLAGRAIRLFLVSMTETGQLSVSDIRLAEQIVITPGPTLGILTDSGNALSDLGVVLENL
jgi:hypothetical protein